MSEGNQGPWSIEEARSACRGAARRQKTAEENLREAAKDFALAEEAYRKALAIEIVRQHADEGAAWTVAPDLARGDSTVAKLRRERDIKEGVREAMQQAAWRCSANRKDAQRFSDWSQRREFAENYGSGELDWSTQPGVEAGPKPTSGGRELDGRTWDEMPTAVAR